jgi:hypothetical protein
MVITISRIWLSNKWDLDSSRKARMPTNLPVLWFKGEIYIRHAAEKGVIRWEYSQPPSEIASDVSSRDADSRPAKGSTRRLGLS